MNDSGSSQVSRRTVLGALTMIGTTTSLGLGSASATGAGSTADARTESSAPEATTRHGKVRGKRTSGGGSAFLGIPYAQPPVGDLRLARPAPPIPWTGVRDAVAFGPAVPQVPPNTAVPAGDDWLTLNIWLPPGADKPVPVMVWIYGGGYASGSADEPTFDGSVLAREGRVAVVTFNYRTGVDGFSHIPGAPANRGLLDQVALLRWLRENVGAFGGDARNVTVFGESSGAGCVAALLAMPSARGLLRRAIVQSMPRPYVTARLAYEIGGEIAASAGVGFSREEMARVPAQTLAEHGAGLQARTPDFIDRWGQVAAVGGVYGPVVDGVVLPVDPYRALADGAACDIELIVGHTRDENRLFTALTGQVGKIGPTQLEQALNIFAPHGDPVAYQNAFPGATDEELYEIVRSDWLFRMPNMALATAHARAGGRTYFYEFVHEAVGVGGIRASLHGIDVPLVFGNWVPGTYSLVFANPPTDEDHRLGTEVRRAWTRFAHTGSPGWPRFTGERNAPTKIWGRGDHVGLYPELTSWSLAHGERYSPYDVVE
ncbi:carboxylesterase/lipase family protein [Umezawaea endophytica]|uniref:Carboxylic ester hydrolase n=1 Tax=Umezawaea endophytica TaxID=1654476 RepID=A0A9X3A5P7_9PSEU|nr:carboxylesterase family protein [Umezawaea endophytica]MCS7482503.1 carboxylesterase family protein [Umezawaea endophytica]